VRSTSTTSSSPLPSTAPGPRGTRTSTTAPGKQLQRAARPTGVGVGGLALRSRRSPRGISTLGGAKQLSSADLASRQVASKIVSNHKTHKTQNPKKTTTLGSAGAARVVRFHGTCFILSLGSPQDLTSGYTTCISFSRLLARFPPCSTRLSVALSCFLTTTVDLSS
jgi:hypothetical protein